MHVSSCRRQRLVIDLIQSSGLNSADMALVLGNILWACPRASVVLTYETGVERGTLDITLHALDVLDVPRGRTADKRAVIALRSSLTASSFTQRAAWACIIAYYMLTRHESPVLGGCYQECVSQFHSCAATSCLER